MEGTFHLRPDYEDEPEIVECEIYRQSNDLYYTHRGMCPIYTAFGDPDFIGFKFEDVTDWYNEPILYEFNEKNYGAILPEHIKSGKAKVLHATHVLFRKG